MKTAAPPRGTRTSGAPVLTSRALPWASHAVTLTAVVALVGALPYLSGGDPAQAILLRKLF